MTLLEALKKLRDDACTGNISWRGIGICANLITTYPSRKLLLTHFTDWPQSSGCEIYPIGGEKEFDSGDLWTGESLNKRLSLINHVINKIEGIV